MQEIVFIKDKPIYLSDELSEDLLLNSQLIIQYDGSSDIELTVKLFEDSPSIKSLVIYSDNFEKLKHSFVSQYKIIEAAGGIVFNPNNEVLLIHRYDRWDLPKGKIEKKEEPRDAAMREVCEETGINNPKINSFLTETYHTYWDPRKNRRVLKLSFWYLMETKDTELQAQTEEDIELAVWLPLQELKEKKPIYKNILEVIKAYEQGY